MPGGAADKGYIHLYTGNGKGKTTAALGLALRAAGWGFSSYVGQFMKGVEYGEYRKSFDLSKWLTIERFGEDSMQHPAQVRKEDCQRAADGLERTRRAMLSGRYRVVVFDEICVTCAYGLLPVKAVLDVLAEKPEQVEVILTGRDAPQEFYAIADLITEMKEVKHYYAEKGILSRIGIDR